MAGLGKVFLSSQALPTLMGRRKEGRRRDTEGAKGEEEAERDSRKRESHEGDSRRRGNGRERSA